MKFFKQNEEGLTPAQRAERRDEKLGQQYLSKMKALQYAETPAWIAHKASLAYIWTVILSNAPTTVAQDLLVGGVWIAAWSARKSVMKVFMKQLNALDKNTQLRDQVELALTKIRERKGYKPYTPSDKSAFKWVAAAVSLGLAPPASYLNVIQRRKPEFDKPDLEVAEKVKKRWTTLTTPKVPTQKQKG